MSLTINLIAGTGWPPVSPSGANACVQAALDEIGSWIVGTNSIDILVTWENIGSNIASSTPSPAIQAMTYADTKTALNAQISRDELTNNIKSTAYGALPGSAPAGLPGSIKKYILWDAITNDTSYSHAFAYNQITFNSNGITYDTSVPVDNSAITGYGMYQATLHEVTELFQRFSLLTGNTGPLDLFSFSAANTHCFTAASRYSSWDDGVTSLQSGTYQSSSDLLDYSGTETGEGWQGTSTASPFDGSGASGNPQLIRYKDVQILSLMGIPLTARGLMVAGFPTNTVVPTISGTPTVGQTLTATTGTWVGQSSITKQQWQWKRNGSAIGGETGSTYQLQSGDGGATITVTETASNTLGDNTATSDGVLAGGAGTPAFGALSLQLHR